MRASLVAFGVSLSLLAPSALAMHDVGVVSFPDVPSDHPNAKAISILQQAGLFTGYPDGRFGPERQINRAELLKILIGSIGTDAAGTPQPADCYPDVRASDWFSPYVCEAAVRGWVNGYDDGLFRPERSVTLAEALKMFVNVRQYELESRYPALGYERGQWFTPFVDTMLYKDAVSLESVTDGGKNGLDKPLTRMLAAEILYRSFLDDGRLRYAFRTDACDMEEVKRVTLQKYDLSDRPQGAVFVDFDVFGTMPDGSQCLIATHANPYVGVSEWWHSRTMFLVAPRDHDAFLEEVSVAGGKVFFRSGHETAGLGDDLWEFTLKTGQLIQVPFNG